MIDSLLLEIVHPFELQTGQIFIDITINIKTITNTWCPSSSPPHQQHQTGIIHQFKLQTGRTCAAISASLLGATLSYRLVPFMQTLI